METYREISIFLPFPIILMFALKCYSFLIYCNRKFDLVTVISHIILVTFTNLANFIFTQLLTEKWCLLQILSPNWLWLNSIFHSSTPNRYKSYCLEIWKLSRELIFCRHRQKNIIWGFIHKRDSKHPSGCFSLLPLVFKALSELTVSADNVSFHT